MEHKRQPQNSTWWDKVDSKFKDWGETGGKRISSVPNTVVRASAFIGEAIVNALICILVHMLIVGQWSILGQQLDLVLNRKKCAPFR